MLFRSRLGIAARFVTLSDWIELGRFETHRKRYVRPNLPDYDLPTDSTSYER